MKALATGMSRYGHDVEVICLRSPGHVGEQLIDAGVTLRSGVARGKFDLSSLYRLKRIFSVGNDPVLIALDHHDAILLGAISSRMAGIRGKILSVHSTGLWGKQGTFSLTDRLVLHMFDRFVALALPHAGFMEKDGRIPPEKITLIPNGIDTDRFCPPASLDHKNELRRKYSIPENDFVVTIAAALRPEKNHDMFIEVADKLLRSNGDFTFLIAGGGVEAGKLHEIVENTGNPDKIRFMGVRDDVDRIFALSDAAVLCSYPVVETFPLTVLEAMSSGLAVVSTDVGSIAEMFRDGEEGMLVPSEDSVLMAKKLATLKSDPTLRAVMGEKARNRVTGDYSEENMIRGYSELVEGLDR
ncbi:MAG: glycosyltransferase [Bacteroidales bacterium]|nr:glycosyltransferase [Candidatus Latescibacterota bacterium]